MAVLEEVQIGKSYENSRWKGARKVTSLKSVASSRGVEVQVSFLDARSRTGHAMLATFVKNTQLVGHASRPPETQNREVPPSAKTNSKRLSNVQLRKLASKAGILDPKVSGAASAEQLKQLAAFADGVAAHYAAKCNYIAMKHHQDEGTYAAGKKAGALECAKALSL